MLEALIICSEFYSWWNINQYNNFIFIKSYNQAGSEQDLQLFDKEVEHLNVIDVYKIAASIGKEFEKLTDAFGGIYLSFSLILFDPICTGVVFSAVMPKLIRILEMFELLVKNREVNETKIATLTQEVEDFDKSLKMKNVSEAKVFVIWKLLS